MPRWPAMAVCLLAASALPAAGPPGRAFLSAEQRDTLAKAHAVFRHGAKLWRDGKHDDGQKAVELGIRVQRALIGTIMPEVAVPATILAGEAEAAGGYDLAVRLRRELYLLSRAQRGADDWRTFDALLAHDVATRLAKWPAEKRERWNASTATLGRARGLLAAGKYAEAARAAGEAAEGREALLGKGRPEALLARAASAVALGRGGKPAEAVALLREVVDGWRRLKSPGHPGLGGALHHLASALNAAGKHEEARIQAREAADVQRLAWGERSAPHAGTLLLLSSVEERLGRPREALAAALRALAALRDALGPRHDETLTAMNNAAILHKFLGQFAAARALYEEVLRAERGRLGGPGKGYALVLFNLASLCRTEGRLAESERMYREVLAIREKEGQKGVPLADLYNNLAGVMQDRADFKEARRMFGLALEIYRREAGERSLAYAACLQQIGSLASAEGDWKKAQELNERVLAIRRARLGRLHPDLVSTLLNLASLAAERGDYTQAMDRAMQAQEVVAASVGRTHPLNADVLSTLARVRRDTGDPRSALDLFAKALKIEERVYGAQHPATLRTLGAMADLLHTVGQADEALKQRALLYRFARARHGPDHPETASALLRLGLAQARSRDLPAARTSLEAAVAIYERREETGSGYIAALGTLAEVAALQRRHGEALRLCRRVVGLTEKERPGSGAQAQAHAALAVALCVEGEAAEGLEEIRKAEAATRVVLASASAVQSERQHLALLAEWRERLDLLLSLEADATRSHDLALAWKGAAFSGQRRRRIMARALKEGKAEAVEIVQKLEEVTRRLAALSLREGGGDDERRRREIQHLAVSKDLLEGALARLMPAGVGFDHATSAEVARGLPEGVALIDFLVYEHHAFAGKGPRHERRLLAWVVRRGKPVGRVDLGPAAPIEEAVSGWRRLIERDPGDRPDRLRRLVWSPLAKHLGGASLALISPDGVLARMPFAALPGEKAGAYLIEEIALAVVPVPRVLAHPARPPKGGAPRMLLAGGVEFGKGEWAALPATRLEAAAAGRLFSAAFPGGETRPLGGDGLTREALAEELPKVRFAHLATHGFFANEKLRSAMAERRYEPTSLFGRDGVTGWHPGLLSGLVLSGGKHLTALEVAEIDLADLELAVLSACETGLGKEAGGEGVLGLQRAFQSAGCRNVVSSLWSVDDAATSVLMERFYAHRWGKKPLAYPEALRQAQLDVLRGPGLVERRAAELHKELSKAGEERGLRGAGKAAEKLPGAARRAPVSWWAAWQAASDGRD